MNPSQVSEDFSAFAPDSEKTNAELQAMMKQQEKLAKRDAAQAKITAKQHEAAAKLIEVTKEQDDSDAKAAILRKIDAYQKNFKDRLQHVKVTKNTGAKASLEELKIHLADIENELGKSGGYAMARALFVNGCQKIEQVEAHYGILGMDLTHLGKVAEQSVSKRKGADGKIEDGPIEPLLQEFVIKYDSWFSTRVEIRLAIAVVELMAATHKMNSSEVKEFMKAASADTKKVADKL